MCSKIWFIFALPGNPIFFQGLFRYVIQPDFHKMGKILMTYVNIGYYFSSKSKRFQECSPIFRSNTLYFLNVCLYEICKAGSIFHWFFVDIWNGFSFSVNTKQQRTKVRSIHMSPTLWFNFQGFPDMPIKNGNWFFSVVRLADLIHFFHWMFTIWFMSITWIDLGDNLI